MVSDEQEDKVSDRDRYQKQGIQENSFLEIPVWWLSHLDNHWLVPMGPQYPIAALAYSEMVQL